MSDEEVEVLQLRCKMDLEADALSAIASHVFMSGWHFLLDPEDRRLTD
jgi:hypothetical protein